MGAKKEIECLSISRLILFLLLISMYSNLSFVSISLCFLYFSIHMTEIPQEIGGEKSPELGGCKRRGIET